MEALAGLSAALGQAFARDLFTQWNRSAITAAEVPARPGRGHNCAIDVEFSGSVDAVDVDEGSDVGAGEFDSDIDIPATLPWAEYRKAFWISERTIDAAASYGNVTADALVDLFGERVMSAGARLCSKINRDLLNGTGTGTGGFQSIVGMVTACANSGTYFNVSRGARPEWSANVLANGGVPRPLTMPLLAALEQLIFVAFGAPPTAIRTTPGVWAKYEALFESIRRLATDGNGPLAYRAGASQLFWRGVPIIRDKDMPSGTLIMENNAYHEVQFLPKAGTPRDAVIQEMRNLVGGNGNQGGIITATQIPFKIAALAKQGSSVKFMLYTTLQYALKRPNSFGKITDIDET